MRPPAAVQAKWMLCFGVFSCALVLMVWPNALIDFRYDRAALASGQWWRIVTGHMAHLNTAHLLLNLFGLILICELLWWALPWRHGCAILLFSAIGTSALFWHLHPELAWYAGLSAILHGLWAGCGLAGCLFKNIRDTGAEAANGMIQKRWPSSRHFFMGALMLLALKLGLEAWYGPSPQVGRMIDGPVISLAHLYGALTGILYVLIWRGVSGLLFRK